MERDELWYLGMEMETNGVIFWKDQHQQVLIKYPSC